MNEGGSFRLQLAVFELVTIADFPHVQTLSNFRFLDADGTETPVCPDADLDRCIFNGGNLFIPDPVTILGEIFTGCVSLDSPWLGFGLDLGFVEGLISDGLLTLGIYENPIDIVIGFQQTFSALEQITNGCINAAGDLVGSAVDIAGAAVALARNPQAFVGEQLTLIRQTVNEAVDSPDEFISQALADILRLELLQNRPTEWIGTVGCELLIEVLLAATGAGAAAVAARIADRVQDVLNLGRRDVRTDIGDGADIPRGGLTDDVIRLADENLTGSGETVLGHYSDGYVREARQRGASYFDIGDAWDGLSPAQRLEANARVLDAAISNGDSIFLVTPRDLIRPGSSLQWEIDYLVQNGYVFVDDVTLVVQ